MRRHECQRNGLGEEYLGCVDACIQALSRSPAMYAVVHENYRLSLGSAVSVCNLLRTRPWLFDCVGVLQSLQFTPSKFLKKSAPYELKLIYSNRRTPITYSAY